MEIGSKPALTEEADVGESAGLQEEGSCASACPAQMQKISERANAIDAKKEVFDPPTRLPTEPTQDCSAKEGSLVSGHAGDERAVGGAKLSKVDRIEQGGAKLSTVESIEQVADGKWDQLWALAEPMAGKYRVEEKFSRNIFM